MRNCCCRLSRGEGIHLFRFSCSLKIFDIQDPPTLPLDNKGLEVDMALVRVRDKVSMIVMLTQPQLDWN